MSLSIAINVMYQKVEWYETDNYVCWHIGNVLFSLNASILHFSDLYYNKYLKS